MPQKYQWIVALTRFATAVVQPHILVATILLVKKTREGCPTQLSWDLHFALLYDKGRTDNAESSALYNGVEQLRQAVTELSCPQCRLSLSLQR